MGIVLLPFFILFVFIVSFIGCVMGVVVGRWRHSAVWGIGTFFLVWAAVLSPEVFVHAQLHYLCKTQGGVRVYETISEPKSLYFKEDGAVSNGDDWSSSAKVYLDYGYDSIENKLYRDDLYRFWRDQDGQIKRVKIAQPTSHYEESYQGSMPVTKYIWLNEDKITDRTSGKVVAIYKNFGMSGGALLHPLLSKIGAGTGTDCYSYDKNFPKNDLDGIYPKTHSTN